MTFVVTEPCIKCKLTDCVEVCPVDCFHEGANFLVIDPDECIDCTLCVPECPVDAIYDEDELPEGQEHFIELNAELAFDTWFCNNKCHPITLQLFVTWITDNQTVYVRVQYLYSSSQRYNALPRLLACYREQSGRQ